MFIKKNHSGILALIVLFFFLWHLSLTLALTSKWSDTVNDSGQVVLAGEGLTNSGTLAEGDVSRADSELTGAESSIAADGNEVSEAQTLLLAAGIMNPVAGTDTGMVTSAKVPVSAQALKDQVNVRNYGAKGDGITDDTTAIQNAINYANVKGIEIVFIPDGIYQINPDISIRLKSNISLILSAKATLRSNSSSKASYRIINIANVANVAVRGGCIVGERTIHNGSAGTWGHGIGIEGSNNVTISDIAVSNCWGDGIYVGSSTLQNFSDNVSILRVALYNNRRQGISIISAKNLLLKDSKASNCNGTDPQSGLDLEPDYSTQFLQNIVIDNFQTANNAGFGIASHFVPGLPFGNVSIIIRNHTDKGSIHRTLGNIFEYKNAGYDISVE